MSAATAGQCAELGIHPEVMIAVTPGVLRSDRGVALLRA